MAKSGWDGDRRQVKQIAEIGIPAKVLVEGERFRRDVGNAVRRAGGRQQQQEEQAQKQANATKTQEQQNMDNFKRSMSACLDARGYSVR